MDEVFSFRPVGSTGCEIHDQGGSIIAWTVDAAWAAIIVSVLNKAEVLVKLDSLDQ